MYTLCIIIERLKDQCAVSRKTSLCVKGRICCYKYSHSLDLALCHYLVSVWTPNPCGNYQFSCRNGRCLDILRRCNGQDECGDNSDEQGCSTCACLVLVPLPCQLHSIEFNNIQVHTCVREIQSCYCVQAVEKKLFFIFHVCMSSFEVFPLYIFGPKRSIQSCLMGLK